MKRSILTLLLILASAMALGAAAAASWPNTQHRSFQPPDGISPNGMRRGMSLVTVQLMEVGGCSYVVAAKSSEESSPAITHHAACQNPAHSPGQAMSRPGPDATHEECQAWADSATNVPPHLRPGAPQRRVVCAAHRLRHDHSQIICSPRHCDPIYHAQRKASAHTGWQGSEQGQEVLDGVRTLTRQDDETYEAFIARICRHRDGLWRNAKAADCLANLCDSPAPSQVKRYAAALLVLTPDLS